jgi:hypothetical protein
MGRRQRDENDSSPQNNSIWDSEGNEKNEYPVPDSKKTKIIDAKDPTMPTRTSSKKKSCK